MLENKGYSLMGKCINASQLCTSDNLEEAHSSSSECQVRMVLYHVTYINAVPTHMKSFDLACINVLMN